MISSRATGISTPVPLEIVGSSTFGRKPKISIEKRFNFFIEDDFLINFAGYKFTVSLLENGRGIFSSTKSGLIFAVSNNTLYEVSNAFTPIFVMTLSTNSGDVFIDEDILGNICLTDGVNIYVYNYINKKSYIAGTAVSDVGQVISPLDFVPNYVFFHDGRFISTSSSSGGNKIGQWRLSSTKTITVSGVAITYIIFPPDAQHQGGFQTKPDAPIAGSRFPGRGNLIILMGRNVCEIWNDLGFALFPYQRQSTFNIDYGCLNSATVASLNNMVVWLGANEQSGPVIMYSTGQDIKKISTSGIDNLFESVQFPQECYGYTVMQSGHLFYVLTFFNPADNFTLAYDFNQDKFYNLCDENLNYHIAKRTVFFNNSYYFISINDGGIYQLNSKFNTYEYSNGSIKEIPRVMMLKTYRTPDGRPIILNDLAFTVEQGVDEENTGQGNNINEIILVSGGSLYTHCSALIEGDGAGAYAAVTLTSGVVTDVTLVDQGVGYSWAVITLIGDGYGAFADIKLNTNSYVPRVDISVSYDGGERWTNFDQMQLTTYGNRKSRFYYEDLGYGNEFTLQFRVWCKSRFICTNGEMSFYS